MIRHLKVPKGFGSSHPSGSVNWRARASGRDNGETPMARGRNVVELKSKKRKPAAKRRKGPLEWRAINRSARVKDGRSVLLAVPAPRKRGELLVIEAYWDVHTKAWWPANCASGVPGCEPAADTYGEPTMWMPLPAPPMKMAA
jgi:hypothetical protein